LFYPMSGKAKKPAAKPAAAATKGGKKATEKPVKSTSKKVAEAAPRKKDWKSQHKHLFNKETRNYSVGRSILPKDRDLTRFVKWPRYVRLQRQRAILKKRLKVPPAINHFSKTLEKNQASTLFRLLSSYIPESAEDKKKRLEEKAAKEEKGQAQDDSKKPKFIKYGLNHITQLVESRKAKLVIIAHDVDPIELVVWLPALCRKLDVPYCIVKGKARLGRLVHKKTAAAIALTDLRKEHVAQLDQFISNVRPMYNDSVADRRKWGGGVLGAKAQAVVRKQEKARAAELAKVSA